MEALILDLWLEGVGVSVLDRLHCLGATLVANLVKTVSAVAFWTAPKTNAEAVAVQFQAH